MLVAAPGMPVGLLKPKCSAIATSLSAPAFTASGAKTELHEWANEFVSDPPHDSPLAFCSSTPSRVVDVWTG